MKYMVWYPYEYSEILKSWKPPKIERFYNQDRKLRPEKRMKAASRMAESPAFHKQG